MKWNHDLNEDDPEGEIFALEVIFGKDEARVGTGEERDNHTRKRNKNAVEKILCQRDFFIGEDGGVMFESRLFTKKIWRGLAQFRCGFQ